MELFASNIHKRTVNGVVEPTLYLNDKMTNLLENDGYLTYVKPLQDMGIKVLLTVLGDWQGIGFNLLQPNHYQTPRVDAGRQAHHGIPMGLLQHY